MITNQWIAENFDWLEMLPEFILRNLIREASLDAIENEKREYFQALSTYFTVNELDLVDNKWHFFISDGLYFTEGVLQRYESPYLFIEYHREKACKVNRKFYGAVDRAIIQNRSEKGNS